MTLSPYPAYRDWDTGGLGQIPGHWGVRRTKTLFRERDQLSGDGAGVLLSLTRARGMIPQADASNRMASAEDLSKYKVCRPGDLVMNRMQAWSGMFALASIQGLVSPDYSVFEATGGSEVKYYEHLFKTPNLVDEFARRSKGIGSGFNRLYTPDFGSVPVTVPPLDEQVGIVRYLDHADRRIRRYIAAKKKLIALLNEQKQAIIHRAVTRGIESNVRLKPSGAEWLGEVPGHWDVGSVGGLCGYISYGFTNPMPAADQGPYMLTANDIGDGAIRFENARRTTQEAFDHLLTQKSRPILGDVLVTKDGTLGRVAVADGRQACINQSVALLRVDPVLMLPGFLSLVLQAPLYHERMIYEAGGSTIKHIYITRLAKMKVAYPRSRIEQSEILANVKTYLSPVELALDSALREIDLAGEYRTRLVADVVTGKLDVREAAANLPEQPGPGPLDDEEGLAEGDESEDPADQDAVAGDVVA